MRVTNVAVQLLRVGNIPSGSESPVDTVEGSHHSFFYFFFYGSTQRVSS